MSTSKPIGVALPVQVAYTANGIPVTTGITVTVDSVERSDGSEIASLAGDPVPKGDAAASAVYYYSIPAAENDRQSETYTVQTVATGVAVDRVYQWAIVTVDQAQYEARRQITIAQASSRDAGTLVAYLQSTWGGTEDGLIDAGKDISKYENLILVFKEADTDLDTAAILEVDIATGLVTLGGVTAVDATKGTLVLTVDNCGAIYEVAQSAVLAATSLTAGRICYQLLGVDTTPVDDVRVVLAEGVVEVSASLKLT